MNERRDKGNSRQRYFTSQEFLNLYMYGVGSCLGYLWHFHLYKYTIQRKV